MRKSPFQKGVNAPSIRKSLALLVVGCILPIAIVAALLILDYYGHQRAQLTLDAISRARAIISVVDRDFANTQAALLALATSHRLATGDFAGFHARAAEVLQNINAENIAVLDPTGQVLLTTALPYGEPLPKTAYPPLLKRTLESGKPGVSDLFLAPVTGHLIVAIAVPVKRDGSTIYSLNAAITPTQLSSVLTAQKLPNSWRVVMFDSTGSIAARTHEIEKFVGKKVTPDLLQRANVSNEDGFESKTLDGILVLTVYSRSPVTNWTVAIGMPLADVTAGIRYTLAWLVAATLAALGIGLWLAWLIGGRIAGSITALTKPARALGFGEMVTIAPLYFKEANELRQAMLDASATLQQTQYEAHHDVLTGLANRALFHIVVDQQLALCRRDKTELAILYIDLDGFKTVNDTHGHETGDQLLRAISVRIRGAIRDSDIAGRLGGDEFAVALVHANMEKAKAFAERLIEIVSNTYQIGETELNISASIGVAGYPSSATDIDALLKDADHAMYKAKELGKRRVCTAQ